MKNQIIFIFVLMALNTKYIMAQGVLFDKQYLHAVQSQDFIGQDASYVFDGIYNSNQTNITNSNALWLQINTKCIRKINTIKIYPVISTNYYVFISKSPFFHINIEALIRDPWVTYFNITGGDGGGPGSSTNIPVGNVLGQYILILSTNTYERISISEVDIYGDYVDCGPYYPPQYPPIIGPQVDPPYGICGPWNWPPNSPPVFPPDIIGPPFIGPDIIDVLDWWSSQEICGDGIDNDKNGLVDCEDYPCGVGTFNVVQTNPTCPICQNGRICVFANNNVNEVSIDNGASWTPFPNTGFYCFENLNAGMYQVRLRTQYGCEEEKDIVLASPNGLIENLDCVNGSFETGTFNGWQGGLLNMVYPSYNDFTLITNPPVSDRMQIVGANYVDPNVPFIQIPSFAARVGDLNSGNESEMLRYCFTVTNNNADFNFNYAVVIEDPMGHPSGYLEYRLLDNTTGVELISPQRTIVTDPLLTPVNGLWFALGWQCASYDLSSLIGHQICLDVIVSNCSATGHGAYAYIDGLCDSPSSPNVNIQANDKICQTQKIKASILGGGFNSYQWEISKINNSGGEYEKVTLPQTGGFQSSIDDLVKLYEESSNFTISCPQKIKLKFIGFADCGAPGKDEKIIDLVCGEDLNIDYCDPLYYCIGANQNQLQIKGINDCTNCTYRWSSPHGLSGMINTTFKFPTLDRSNNSQAFNKEYNVVVTTPEGCEYNDTFTAEQFQMTLSVNPIVLNYCDYVISGTVLLPSNIPNNSLSCTAINTLDGSKIVLDLTGTGLTRTFNKSISREFSSKYRIEVDIVNDYFCKEGNCLKFINLNLVPASPYFKSWKAAWPNVFCNNLNVLGIQCDDDENHFNLTFNTLQTNDCSTVSIPQFSSIYYYNLKIYDRWGNLVFEGTVSKLPTDTNGILGSESAVTWDGLVNGEEPESGVYTWVAKIKSCYSGNNNCYDCENNCNNCDRPDFQYCSEGVYDSDGFEIIAGDVTLLN